MTAFPLVTYLTPCSHQLNVFLYNANPLDVSACTRRNLHLRIVDA